MACYAAADLVDAYRVFGKRNRVVPVETDRIGPVVVGQAGLGHKMLYKLLRIGGLFPYLGQERSLSAVVFQKQAVLVGVQACQELLTGAGDNRFRS